MTWPLYTTVNQAAQLRDGLTPWETPLSTCCLVAIHNGEGCYRHAWPLAVQVVTRLHPDYFTPERVAQREQDRLDAEFPDW